MINIVFLVFGDKLTYYEQTYLSVLSVLRRKRAADEVTLFAENVSYFRRLEKRVRIMPLDHATRDRWENGTGYYFRNKIKALEMASSLYPESHLLFLDGDTFFVGDFDAIEQRLDRNIGLLHLVEGHPSQMNRPARRMWKAVNGLRVGEVTISMKHKMWNSGVIGIPQAKKDTVVALALRLCDAILDTGKACFTAEQYSFSISLNELVRVEPADRWVWHYWGNKGGWALRTGRFLVGAHLLGLTLDEEIAMTDTFVRDRIPVYVDKSNTQRRLIRLVKWLFKDKVPR